MSVYDVSEDLLDSAHIRIHQPIQPARPEPAYLLMQGFGALRFSGRTTTDLHHLQAPRNDDEPPSLRQTHIPPGRRPMSRRPCTRETLIRSGREPSSFGAGLFPRVLRGIAERVQRWPNLVNLAPHGLLFCVKRHEAFLVCLGRLDAV